MRKGVYERMTQEEILENMFLMDKVVIVATNEQLDRIGLSRAYFGRVGYVDTFDKNNIVTLDLGNEKVKVYKDMIDDYYSYAY